MPEAWITSQDDAPPQVHLVVKAATDLEAIYVSRDRSVADMIRAVDALGRALMRLKDYLRTVEE